MKKTIHLLLRLISWGCIAALLICVAASALLHYAGKQAWFREKLLSAAQQALQREVQIGKLSAGLSYVRVQDVRVAEEGGFETGTFLAAGNARVRFSLWHLFHFHFKGKSLVLQQVDVNIVRHKDGTFNFETLGTETATQPAEKEDETDSFPLEVSFRDVSIDNLNFTYTDLQNNSTFSAQHLSLGLRRFALDKAFGLSLSGYLSYQDTNGRLDIPVGLTAKTYLANLDFASAYAQDIRLTAKYQNTVVNTQGRVDNFENPSFALRVTAAPIPSSVASPWLQSPPFTLPSLTLDGAGTVFTSKSELKFSSFTAQVPGAFVWASGTYNYAKNTYAANGKYGLTWDQALAWLPEQWVFYHGEADAQGTFNVSDTQARAKVNLQAQGASVQGEADYHFATQAYNGFADVSTDFSTLAPYLPSTWEKYGLDGQIVLWARTANGRVESTATIKQGAFFHPRTGHFSDVSLTLSGQENSNLKTGQVRARATGKLNQGPFTLAANISQKPGVVDAELTGHADRIALPPLPPEELRSPAEEFVSDTALEPVAQTPWPLPPVRLKADLTIDSLDAPHLYATDLAFTADVTGLTPQLDQTQGALKLSMGNGTILDLYRLTNASPLTKVLFLSINIVGKVFNSLNVFAVLNGLGKGVVSAVTGGKKEEVETRMVVQPMLDKNGQPVEVLVPYTETKAKGQQHFDKFETEVKFAEGVASIRKGTFVSDAMSVRLDGTTDFNTGAVNMQVHAAPGKHEVTGVMPLTIKISGTVAEPKGSMSILSSVTSLVTQGVTRNVVSRNVHKGLKGFINLFRSKKETDTPAAEENATADETATPQAQEPAQKGTVPVHP